MNCCRSIALVLWIVLALPPLGVRDGSPAAEASFDNERSVKDVSDGRTPANLTLRNAAISVTLHTADGTFSVRDRRTKRTWIQRPFAKDVVLKGAEGGDCIQASLVHAPSGLEVKTTVRLDGDLPEFTVTLSAKGDLPAPLMFPHPFVTETGTYLVIPMNEGISYPVDDDSIPPSRPAAYHGHGICMAFWGATDGERGCMAILETPDDAAINMDRVEGKLCVTPEWRSQKGQFGYTRRLRYVFLDKGGHVAMCKRYRAYSKKIGLFKTLKQKRKENPDVDLLVGAVNVWYKGDDACSMANEMKSLGIERILWSMQQSPDVIRSMNGMGILTSRYDIYQDLMDPENYKFLERPHPDWPAEAWPRDILIGPDGNWVRWWQVKGKDDKWYTCGLLCDRQALKYAGKRIPEELKTHPYRGRFIDTTTSTPWRECYSPDHPTNRSESRRWRMDLLRFMSKDMKLVTGSETGHDAAVPYVHYFEGMMSLGPYMVPDSGRNLFQIWDEVPEPLAKFQVGHQYRLPLWELVYHDCVAAHWYWGDYNNKLPAVWDRRDLFNILYGTPPMFMFQREFWKTNKERFVRSYKNICPIAQATGYSEMTDHRFLTRDRTVQQTKFANGVVVTVNFGEGSHRLPDGAEVQPMGYHAAGVGK